MAAVVLTVSVRPSWTTLTDFGERIWTPVGVSGSRRSRDTELASVPV